MLVYKTNPIKIGWFSLKLILCEKILISRMLQTWFRKKNYFESLPGRDGAEPFRLDLGEGDGVVDRLMLFRLSNRLTASSPVKLDAADDISETAVRFTLPSATLSLTYACHCVHQSMFMTYHMDPVVRGNFSSRSNHPRTMSPSSRRDWGRRPSTMWQSWKRSRANDFGRSLVTVQVWDKKNKTGLDQFRDWG